MCFLQFIFQHLAHLILRKFIEKFEALGDSKPDHFILAQRDRRVSWASLGKDNVHFFLSGWFKDYFFRKNHNYLVSLIFKDMF